MTPTGNEDYIRLASKNWDSATCASVMEANLGFIEGIAECLRATDTGTTNVCFKKIGEALAGAAEAIACVSVRREQIRRDEELHGDAMALTKKMRGRNDQERKELTLRGKFFFNHLDEEGWELYKSCFLAPGETEASMRQAFESMLEEKSVSTGTNIFDGPVSAS